MKTDLLTILRERHPELFSNPALREVECLPGWLRLLDDLCDSLQKYLDHHPQVPAIRVTRVKEKWGELRFYFNGGDRYCREIADKAVTASLAICEVCGSGGALLGERWVRVRCTAHISWESASIPDEDEMQRDAWQ